MVYIIGSGPAFDISNILEAIEKDKDIFRQNKDMLALDACRLILGEIQRDPKKDYSNENVTKILKTLRKQTLKHPHPDILLVQMIDTYVEPPVPSSEIIAWLHAEGHSPQAIKTLGMRAYRIIGEAKIHFGDRDVDGDVIKEIIDGVLNGTSEED